jgi:hypothetical protein
VECCGSIKLANAQLAKSNDSTMGEAGPPKKSIKKTNVTIAECSQADPTLQAKLVSEIKHAQPLSQDAELDLTAKKYL